MGVPSVRRGAPFTGARSRFTASITNEATADYYGTQLKIRDFDTALGYIFSVCPLPKNATPDATYLPLVAFYCKFISLMVFDERGMKESPHVAYIAVGAQSSSGGMKFGATIRVKNKNDLQKFWYDQLIT